MAVIRYSLAKLLLFALVQLAMGGFFLCVLLRPEGFMHRQGRGMGWLQLIAEHDWLSGGLFALCFGGAVLFVALAFGDRTALAIDASGVEIRTVMARHQADWSDVAGIGFEHNTRRAGHAETLTVRLRRNGGEKKVRVAMGLLAQSREEVRCLLGTADRSRTGQVPVRAQPAVRSGFGRRSA